MLPREILGTDGYKKVNGMWNIGWMTGMVDFPQTNGFWLRQTWKLGQSPWIELADGDRLDTRFKAGTWVKVWTRIRGEKDEDDEPVIRLTALFVDGASALDVPSAETWNVGRPDNLPDALIPGTKPKPGDFWVPKDAGLDGADSESVAMMPSIQRASNVVRITGLIDSVVPAVDYQTGEPLHDRFWIMLRQHQNDDTLIPAKLVDPRRISLWRKALLRGVPVTLIGSIRVRAFEIPDPEDETKNRLVQKQYVRIQNGGIQTAGAADVPSLDWVRQMIMERRDENIRLRAGRERRRSGSGEGGETVAPPVTSAVAPGMGGVADQIPMPVD
jgi:hypothetical protein